MMEERNSCISNIFTLISHAPSFLSLLASRKSSAFAFTMAEILISLTIIGIVAMLTLSTLIGNVNEHAWEAKRRALYNRMTQAIAMLPSLNNFGDYTGTWNDGSVNVSKDTAAQTFVTDGLAKVLKINNICAMPANTDSNRVRNEFKKCGIVSKYTAFGGGKVDIPTRLSEMNSAFNSYSTVEGERPYDNPLKFVNTQAVAFETANGDSLVAFYNPRCYDIKTSEHAREASAWTRANNYPVELPDKFTLYFSTFMCVNFLYDLNGTRGPNQMYKDMGFITVFYPTDSELAAPVFAKTNAKNPDNPSTIIMSHDLTARACHNQDKNSRVPNMYDYMARLANKKSIRGEATFAGYAYWTSTMLTSEYAYVGYGGGRLSPTRRSATGNSLATYTVRCVKK